MGKKIWVEVCLISARGLKRTSSLWKLQWFAVGWIDPENKYCTKIDSSGNSNPVWKTKFSMAVDASEMNFQDLSLRVEVYSREPIFLGQRLLGTATVVLKEFLDKYSDDTKSEVSKPVEEVGSFQLRKRNSNKPQGFVDVSIRISEEREEPSSSYIGADEGFNLTDQNDGIKLASRYGSLQPHTPHLPPNHPHRPSPAGTYEGYNQTDHNGSGIKLVSRYGSSRPDGPHLPPTTSHQPENTHMAPITPNYPHHPEAGEGYNRPDQNGGIKLVSRYGTSRPHLPPTTSHQPENTHMTPITPNYQPPRTPPPPPPPSNVGYIPNFFPGTNNYTPSYINMPSSSAAPPPGRGGGSGFAMGVGAGALAAGAVIFGDDFMSGFDVPGGGLRDASLTISTDPPF